MPLGYIQHIISIEIGNGTIGSTLSSTLTPIKGSLLLASKTCPFTVIAFCANADDNPIHITKTIKAIVLVHCLLIVFSYG